MLWADEDLSNTLHAKIIEIIIAPCSQTAGKKKCFHNFNSHIPFFLSVSSYLFLKILLTVY